MKIIHVMADGTTRKSIEGVVVQSEQFYRVAQGIIEKRGVKNQKIKKPNQRAAKADPDKEAETGRLDGRARYT